MKNLLHDPNKPKPQLNTLKQARPSDFIPGQNKLVKKVSLRNGDGTPIPSKLFKELQYRKSVMMNLKLEDYKVGKIEIVFFCFLLFFCF